MENKLKPSLRFKGFTDAWEQRKFQDLLSYERPDNYIVKSDKYFDVNETPVLTANKGFILGYTNEKRTYNKPCIIFDDFTLDTKYVDFKFMVKSSAIKILNAKNGNNLRFSYELLNSTKLESLGHARHYISVVQPTDIVVPEISEQIKISNFYFNLDNLITLHQRKYKKLINIKKAMLEKMFPKNGFDVPEIRFKGFTDAWEQRKLSEVADYRNGKAHENSINSKGKYIVVNSKFVSTDGNIFKCTNELIEPLFKNEICFVLSDVPNGKAIAKTLIIPKNGLYSLNQRIAGITSHSDVYYYFLNLGMNKNKYFLSFDDGVKQTNLSVSDVMNFEFYYPKYNEQKEIGKMFESLDNLITLHQRKYKINK